MKGCSVTSMFPTDKSVSLNLKNHSIGFQGGELEASNTLASPLLGSKNSQKTASQGDFEVANQS